MVKALTIRGAWVYVRTHRLVRLTIWTAYRWQAAAATRSGTIGQAQWLMSAFRGNWGHKPLTDSWCDSEKTARSTCYYHLCKGSTAQSNTSKPGCKYKKCVKKQAVIHLDSWTLNETEYKSMFLSNVSIPDTKNNRLLQKLDINDGLCWKFEAWTLIVFQSSLIWRLQ